jgi:hypothetical protein
VKPARSTSALQHALDQVVAAGVPAAVVLAREGARTTVLTSGFGEHSRTDAATSAIQHLIATAYCAR